MARIPAYPASVLSDADVGVTVAPASYVAAQLVTTTLVPGAEGSGVANAFDVTIQVVDLAGNPVARVQQLHCELFDLNMLAALVAAFRLSEVGAGAEVTATAKPAMLITTSAAGVAVVRITDVSGASTAAMRLIVTPVSTSGTYTPGLPATVVVQFA